MPLRISILTPAAIGASSYLSNAAEHEDGTDGLGRQRGFAFPRRIPRRVGDVVPGTRGEAARGRTDREAT